MYDRFSGFIKFWSSERNTEDTTPYLYFNEESDYACDNGSFAPPFSTIKKLNIITLQLPIYYMLYWNIGISIRISIGANADIARTKREKGIVIVVKRWMQACYFG